jgi:hypothetical protein
MSFLRPPAGPAPIEDATRLGEEQERQWWSTEAFVAADASDRPQGRSSYVRSRA